MITVGELITRLRQYDPTLPVALRDWSEEYSAPSYEAAQQIALEKIPTGEESDHQKVVLLG